jgi:hypothetical protein
MGRFSFEKEDLLSIFQTCFLQYLGRRRADTDKK